ncbi:DUF1439 domain-containing protein [Pseudoxanthomonas wuyuanensis]|uniref:DUF1439 domain-containing protein n=1 Tax=Pseudoxanthomonas wuyuanensis TaxID=1073196 RepID=A0A286DD91_9GAMM|nr:DUF1439 domain-containing protein [Pseudoxanthomonas wuyuanensis]KAF1720705.1 DUF1439 domain-containing protein [Pseudoxanthomonas wuyuanensis]SOD56615.1 Protein of unknown function [Pseudoxanthomonas wuyuanensis]
MKKTSPLSRSTALLGLALSWLLALPAMAQSLPEISGNQASVGAAQIQQFLAGEFPQQHETLGGLLTLTVSDPVISIPADGQRLHLEFSAAAGSGGSAPTPVGRLSMSSGLRYDPQRMALLLDQPTLDGIQPASPGQRVDSRTQMLINLWLADYARDEPLYQLDDATRALLGELQVQSTSIENGRVVVRFNQDIGAAMSGSSQ